MDQNENTAASENLRDRLPPLKGLKIDDDDDDDDPDPVLPDISSNENKALLPKAPEKPMFSLVPIDVYFRSREVKIAEFNLSIKATVRTLKENIFQRTKIPIADQRIIFSGKSLTDDDKTLEDYSIRSATGVFLWSTIAPELVEQVTHEFKSSGVVSCSAPIEASPTIPASTLVTEAAPASTNQRQDTLLPPAPMPESKSETDEALLAEVRKITINIHSLNNPVTQFNLSITDKVGKLKAEIRDKLGTPTAEQRLVFDAKELSEDDKTLESCGMNKGVCVLHLVRRTAASAVNPGRLSATMAAPPVAVAPTPITVTCCGPLKCILL